MKANRTWTRTAAGGTGLAVDLVPEALNTATDNVTTINPPTVRTALPLRGVALFYSGTGATATLAIKLHVWEETAGAYIRFATATLAKNVISRIEIPAALDVVTGKAWQSTNVLVTLDGDGAAGNGSYVFYLWADLGP